MGFVSTLPFIDRSVLELDCEEFSRKMKLNGTYGKTSQKLSVKHLSFFGVKFNFKLLFFFSTGSSSI